MHLPALMNLPSLAHLSIHWTDKQWNRCENRASEGSHVTKQWENVELEEADIVQVHHLLQFSSLWTTLFLVFARISLTHKILSSFAKQKKKVQLNQYI